MLLSPFIRLGDGGAMRVSGEGVSFPTKRPVREDVEPTSNGQVSGQKNDDVV